MNLRNKKELISRMLGVGKDRIKFDPERLQDIEDAVTKDDIRSLIDQGAIKIEQIKGQKTKKEKRKRGPGSRKGKKTARTGKKERWVKQVRALRNYLKSVKSQIPRELYWEAYRKVKGGEIRTVARLKEFLGGSQ
ncbi:MAG: 50S ribosomal protein L19e [Nitrososphaeria archaeon]